MKKHIGLILISCLLSGLILETVNATTTDSTVRVQIYNLDRKHKSDNKLFKMRNHLSKRQLARLSKSELLARNKLHEQKLAQDLEYVRQRRTLLEQLKK